MLAEFIKSIVELGRDSVKPHFLTDPRDDRKVYLVEKGGLANSLPDVQPRLNPKVETTEDLFEAIGTFGGQRASVWHDHGKIIAVMCNESRSEWATLWLQKSDFLRAINELPHTFDQRSLIRFLRIELAGAVEDAVVSNFRNITFRTRGGGDASINHGDESLGRSVESSVEARSEIPEVITAFVPVYKNPGLGMRFPIRLGVDIDPHASTITLVPLPDAITIAMEEAQREIGVILSEQAETVSTTERSVSVFYGTPILS